MNGKASYIRSLALISRHVMHDGPQSIQQLRLHLGLKYHQVNMNLQKKEVKNSL